MLKLLRKMRGSMAQEQAKESQEGDPETKEVHP
jgi:hypothetical protein